MESNILANLIIISNIKNNQKIIIENSIIIKIDESYIPSVSRYIYNINRFDIIYPICYTYTYIFTYFNIYFKDKVSLIDASFNGLLKLKLTYNDFDTLNNLYDLYYEIWNNIKKQELTDNSTQIDNIELIDNSTQIDTIELIDNSTQTINMNNFNNLYEYNLF